MIATPLNAFQEFILQTLNNLLLLNYVDISIEISNWRTTHLKDTLENVNSWVKQLLDTGLIDERINKIDIFFLAKPGNEKMAPTFSTYTISQKGRNYLASRTTAGKDKIAEKDETVKPNEYEKIIVGYLYFLDGILKGQKVMEYDEYKRLIQYTTYIFETGNLPPIIAPISQTGVSNNFLMRTFFLLYKQYKRKVKRENWIEFLHQVFIQFTSAEKSSTSKHFSQYPKGSSFDRDRDAIVIASDNK